MTDATSSGDAAQRRASQTPEVRVRRQADQQRRLRLCYTRNEVAAATGLSYRSIVNLEARGLLRRVAVGVNVACYSAASVWALFGDSTPDMTAQSSPTDRQAQ